MRRRHVIAVISAAFLLSSAIGACAAIAGIETISIDGDSGLLADVVTTPDGGGMPSPTDGSTDTDAPIDARALCAPTAPFGAPVPIAELNTTSDDWSARFSPDETVVYFASARVNPVNIFSATRGGIGAPFGVPSSAGIPTPGGAAVYCPSFLPNQEEVFVHLLDQTGVPTIAVSARISTTAAFSLPTSVGTANATGTDNADPFLTPDGSGLWFSSNRDGGVFRVYHSSVVGSAVQLPTLETLGSDTEDAQYPVLSDDGLTIYFSSRRNADDPDIYRATRATTADGWASVTSVGERNAAAADDAPSWLSPDGCRLYLMSNRTSGQGMDIFVASRSP